MCFSIGDSTQLCIKKSEISPIYLDPPFGVPRICEPFLGPSILCLVNFLKSLNLNILIFSKFGCGFKKIQALPSSFQHIFNTKHDLNVVQKPDPNPNLRGSLSSFPWIFCCQGSILEEMVKSAESFPRSGVGTFAQRIARNCANIWQSSCRRRRQYKRNMVLLRSLSQQIEIFVLIDMD